MKNFARKIIHYVGVAFTMPAAAMFFLSYTATYFLQLARVVVRKAFGEPYVKQPIIDLRNCLRNIADALEELI